jgi:glycosyltransferase involved in cell wall biosynthesis
MHGGTPTIVHLINTLSSIGGAERLVLDLATHAPRRPTQVITWTTRDTSLLKAARPGILDVIALRPWSMKAARRAWIALRQADIVHVHLSPSQFLGSLLPKPTVFTQHNSWNRRRAFPLSRQLDRLSYRTYDAVVGVSQAVATNLADWVAPARLEVRTIVNGIDLSRFSRTSRSWPGTHGRIFKIGMAARFGSTKDHKTLIRAMCSLPDTYHLLLAGAGPLEAKLQALVARLGLVSRVHFLGLVSDMAGFYDRIDAYVQSSRYDGFSLVAAEAMASGLPTIASNIQGLRDTIGRSDLLFEAGKPEALVARLVPLIESRARYEEASRYSVERSGAFDVAQTAAQYQRLYAELLAARSGEAEAEHPFLYADAVGDDGGMSATQSLDRLC